MNVYLCSNHYSQWPFSIFNFRVFFKWVNVIQRRDDYFVALSVFKCIHGMSPSYLSDSVTMYDEIVVIVERLRYISHQNRAFC